MQFFLDFIFKFINRIIGFLRFYFRNFNGQFMNFIVLMDYYGFVKKDYKIIGLKGKCFKKKKSLINNLLVLDLQIINYFVQFQF